MKAINHSTNTSNTIGNNACGTVLSLNKRLYNASLGYPSDPRSIDAHIRRLADTTLEEYFHHATSDFSFDLTEAFQNTFDVRPDTTFKELCYRVYMEPKKHIRDPTLQDRDTYAPAYCIAAQMDFLCEAFISRDPAKYGTGSYAALIAQRYNEQTFSYVYYRNLFSCNRARPNTFLSLVNDKETRDSRPVVPRIPLNERIQSNSHAPSPTAFLRNSLIWADDYFDALKRRFPDKNELYQQMQDYFHCFNNVEDDFKATLPEITAGLWKSMASQPQITDIRVIALLIEPFARIFQSDCADKNIPLPFPEDIYDFGFLFDDYLPFDDDLPFNDEFSFDSPLPFN